MQTAHASSLPSTPTKPSLFVAIPCYGGQIHVGCFQSLIGLVRVCANAGIKMTIATQPSDSLITRARNSLVAEFLGHSAFTHMMFIDADISFRPEDVVNMLMADRHVVAGCYPKKGLDVGRLRAVAVESSTSTLSSTPAALLSDEAVVAKSLHYAVNVFADGLQSYEDEQRTARPDEKGFLPVDEVATGFMMIRRDVFERLKTAHPHKQYVNDSAGYLSEASKDNFYTFFDCMLHPKTKRYLSEDYAFCYLCRQLDIPVCVDLRVNLTHTGVFDYRGNFLASLT